MQYVHVFWWLAISTAAPQDLPHVLRPCERVALVAIPARSTPVSAHRWYELPSASARADAVSFDARASFDDHDSMRPHNPLPWRWGQLAHTDLYEERTDCRPQSSSPITEDKPRPQIKLREVSVLWHLSNGYVGTVLRPSCRIRRG